MNEQINIKYTSPTASFAEFINVDAQTTFGDFLKAQDLSLNKSTRATVDGRNEPEDYVLQNGERVTVTVVDVKAA